MGQSEQGIPTETILVRGRMALEALKAREEAARFHAAGVDLQIALLEAETGNQSLLELWLNQYRSLVDQDSELCQHFVGLMKNQSTVETVIHQVASESVRPPHVWTLGSQPLQISSGQELVSNPNLAGSESEVTKGAVESVVKIDSDDNGSSNASPWLAMIAGAEQRDADSKSSESNSLSESVQRLCTQAQEIYDVHDVSSNKYDVDDEFIFQRETEADETAQEDDASENEPVDGLFDVSPEFTPYASEAFDTTLAAQEPKPNKAKWLRLSPSFIGSTLAHAAMLIGMSSYVIHIARNPEPKAIMAAEVETETISMEAPMELVDSETPEIETNESPMPAMPSISAVASATSSSDIQLPSSMTGTIANSSSPGTGSVAEQATGTSSFGSPGANAANSVQFFGVKAAGNTFCYVVDASPSMKNDGAFAAAKAELLRSLSLLKPKQRFFISFFGGEIERLKLSGHEEAYPVYATPENLKEAAVWIDRVRVQKNGLPPNEALREAIKMEPDGVFLLFDGKTTSDVAAYLRKVNRSDDLISSGTVLVQIHTIGFYTDEFEGLMKRIASENRGTYRFVPKPTKPR